MAIEEEFKRISKETAAVFEETLISIAAAFGVGVYEKGLKLDLASSYHQVLGFIPEVSLTYVFEKN